MTGSSDITANELTATLAAAPSSDGLAGSSVISSSKRRSACPLDGSMADMSEKGDKHRGRTSPAWSAARHRRHTAQRHAVLDSAGTTWRMTDEGDAGRPTPVRIGAMLLMGMGVLSALLALVFVAYALLFARSGSLPTWVQPPEVPGNAPAQLIGFALVGLAFAGAQVAVGWLAY